MTVMNDCIVNISQINQNGNIATHLFLCSYSCSYLCQSFMQYNSVLKCYRNTLRSVPNYQRNSYHPFFSQYANSEAVDNYNVTVRKVSGESSNRDSFITENSSLTLILSYSAYNISIRALNSAGSSPVSSIAIEQMDEWRGTLLSYFLKCYMQTTLVSLMSNE